MDCCHGLNLEVCNDVFYGRGIYCLSKIKISIIKESGTQFQTNFDQETACLKK